MCKRTFFNLTVLVALAGAGCASVESTSHEERMAALSRVKDERVLFGYATDERLREDVRTAAFERLTRPDLLYKIAQDKERTSEMRRAALRKIRDDGVLFRVAADGEFEREYRAAAIDGVRDGGVLGRIAMDGSIGEGLRARALKRIGEDAVLAEIAQNPGAGESLRVAALRRIRGDGALASVLPCTGLPAAELSNALRRIANEDVLGEVMADSRVAPVLRQEAAKRVSDEELLVEYAVDATVAVEEREWVAQRLYSPESCERALLEGGFGADTQIVLAEHITEDAARVRLLRSGGIYDEVKKRLAENIGDGDELADVVGDPQLGADVRAMAAEQLRRDSRRLVAVFRKSRDLLGAALALERLPSEATASGEDQRRLLGCFKEAEKSGRRDRDRLMALFAGRICSDAGLWHVAELGARVPVSVRVECLGRISDTNLLRKAALRKGDSQEVRAAALRALDEKGGDLQNILRAAQDATTRILVLQHLPAEKVRAPGVQKRLVQWFEQFGESADDMDSRVRLIGLLAPEAEVDGERIQRAIAQTLAVRDSPELRRLVRPLLVNPEAVDALVCGEFGRNVPAAEWAVGLIVGEAWLERAAERAMDPEVLLRLLARMEREDSICKIAERTVNEAAVRAAAVSRLGKGAEELLRKIAEREGADEAGVAAAALAALERANSPVAIGVREQRMAAEREREEKRRVADNERQRADEEALRHEREDAWRRSEGVLSEKGRIFRVQADVRLCQIWGRLEAEGKIIKPREMSLPGIVTKTETHWVAADELWMTVDCEGMKYSVYAKTSDLNGATPGTHVWVRGDFSGADDLEVRLKSAVVNER